MNATVPKPSNVSAVARAIAAGVCDYEGGPALRVTVTLLPHTAVGRFSLGTWPEVADTLLRAPPQGQRRQRVGLAVRPVGGGPVRTMDGQLAWNPPEPDVRTWIGKLWTRLVAPPSAIWPGQSHPLDDLWDVLHAGCNDPPPSPSSVLSMPTATASVAFPLERARLLLGHLAPPGAPISARAGLRTEFKRLSGKPLQLASVTRHSDVFPELPVPGDGILAGLQYGTAAMPAPDLIATAMLAGGPAADAIFDHMHAAHHAALTVDAPPFAETNPPSCDPPDELQNIARRRLGALLSLPSFQRLVGLALDVAVPQQELKKVGWIEEGDTFWEIGLDAPPADIYAGWTLARRRMESERPTWFMPCTRAEAAGAALDSQDTRETLVHLGDRSTGTPRYDLCTFDATLATEADCNRQETRAAAHEDDDSSDARRADLQFGGLRLVDRFPERQIFARDAAGQRRRNNTATCSGTTPAAVEDADDLVLAERLYIGMHTALGQAWRSPFYRIVRYEDPLPPDGAPPDWVEAELRSRLGPADGKRRLELDASPKMFAPMLKENGTEVADGIRACWTGEAMGFDAPSPRARPDPKSAERVDRWTVRKELDVTRHYRLVSAGKNSVGEEVDACFLNPLLRNGWAYSALLARVFPAGISLTPAEAGAVAARPGNADLALPTLPRSKDTLRSTGRRFLRHQPVGAPIIALPPNERLLQPLLPTASLNDAVLRTATGKYANRATPGPIRRVLLAPKVALHEAALHDVFRELPVTIGVPRSGLNGALKEEGTVESSLPPLLRFDGKPNPKPYYPDPAAAFMVIALRLPRSSGDTGWVDEHTVVLPLTAPHDPRATWPDALPVQVIVRRWAEGQALIQSTPSFIGGGKATLPCHTVTVALRPGQAYTLVAWCIPSIAQLRDWFDVIESAALLATAEGGATGKDETAQACTRGLAALLSEPATPMTDAPPQRADPPQPRLCTGAGGLPVPSPDQLYPIAATVHHELRRRPIPGLVHVSTIDLLHAAETSALVAPEITPETLRVVRRDAADQDALLQFLSQEPGDSWDAQSDAAGAKTVLFAGQIRIDTASFEALEIYVRCAAPGAAALDPKRGRTARQIALQDSALLETQDSIKLFGFQVDENHQVTWPNKYLNRAMRIDGLPLPADGAPKPMTLSLADLHAQAIRARAAGSGPQTSGNGAASVSLALAEAGLSGLRVTLDSFIDVPEARELEVIPVGISRHSSSLRLASEQAISEHQDALVKRTGAGIPIWLRATARPPAPVLRDVTYAPSSSPAECKGSRSAWTVSQQRLTRVVVRLEPAWHQSGEGEQLAVVLWPPGLFDRGIEVDDRGKALPDFEIREDDLGPAGAFVTRWGGTSSVNDRTVPNALLDPSVFGATPADSHGALVPVAWLPLPDEAGEAKDDARTTTAPAGTLPATPPRRFAAVALRTYLPRFDPIQQLWYFAIDMRTDPMPSPTVRLGLARYQPHAREDLRVLEGVEPEYLRVSEAVTIPVEIMPGRRIDTTCQVDGPDRTDVHVTVQGPSGRPANRDDPTGPGMRIRIQRQRQLPGGRWTREDALDANGQPCVWESWASPGRAIPTRDGWAWSCRFFLPDRVGAGSWRYAALAEEVLRLPPASTPAEGPALEARPTLLEPLWLDPP